MVYVVSGITGNTGAAVADTLLTAGAGVRALVRSKEKAAAWAARGVELVEADLADADALTAALEGAQGAYVLVPPDFPAPDYFASRAPVVDAILRAIARSRVSRVVALSSVAAEQPAGTGPIRVLGPLEAGLRERDGATLLRAAYFQENLAASLEPATSQGVFPVFFDPDQRLAMVSTRDIGRRAAEILLDAAPPPRVVNLAGPEDHTMREAAAILGEVLGARLDVVRQPPHAIAPILRAIGAGQLAELYGELNAAIDAGAIRFETPPAVERGHVALRETFERLLGR